jgi:hypothetical protein
MRNAWRVSRGGNMKAFISYSHRDAESLLRLHTHMAVLKSQNKITDWCDQKILAGGNIDHEISERLEACELFLPLVSPDFLASHYCYEKEMQKAIKQKEAGITQIVSIILQPCDWQATPLIRYKSLPKDGKPVSEWQNENAAYLDIIQELRRIVDNKPEPLVLSHQASPSLKPTQNQRYRVQRTFDEVDRADFRDKSFEIIRDYFRTSIEEIGSVSEIKGRFKTIDANSFTCTVSNQARRDGPVYITVHANAMKHGLGDISYSFFENAPPNTANGGFSIESDGYELSLKGWPSIHRAEDKNLNALQAAKLALNGFFEQAGISLTYA